MVKRYGDTYQAPLPINADARVVQLPPVAWVNN